MLGIGVWRRARVVRGVGLNAGGYVRGVAGTAMRLDGAAQGGDVPSSKFTFTPHQGYMMDVPAPECEANKEDLLQYFTMMLRMRRMEISADVLYKGQAIRGFCHLYDGQEAVVVGMDAALTYQDLLITSYRNHCQALSRGGTVHSVLAELTGRTTGMQKGRGGSMHMYATENGYFGGQGIVGAQTPLGAGLAFALKYYEKPNIAVTMFGDGAANQGQLAEAINMASLWKLPCIFLCENNKYGMGTSTSRASGSGADFYKRGSFIPGMKVDGMDVLAVREGMAYAKKFVLEHGPLYMEMDTYRYHGHSMSDPGITYRSRDEISDIRKSRDPIDRVKSRMIDEGWMGVEEVKALEKKIKKEVDEAVKLAKTDPEPEVKDMYTNVYVEKAPIRGTNAYNGYIP
ncbi:Pyruvate dehydrogenase E1 component subunit alpha-1, mitochondrial [Porphyridium purpureum]|uniref:Pyruvate dehydrogenase E1 component subunit alpha n=1 Tax=Porphyridium purpureum TaxID=35688 RepID=A0A5J4YL75_PORPP|nr:Pyruvate dehydrogenase E1 component subunit alpha-1, mitochondrial [Porphyridium purpureum]|eukprot:POR0053..scf246_12